MRPKWRRSTRSSFADINGRPGLVLFTSEALFAALTIEASDGRIAAIYPIQSPERLRRLAQALPLGSLPLGFWAC
ncbi:hypothetical protein GCM10011611_17600 [Aliidongia dinghuensis]|uniref:Uncharacterized protein n=1 Tax=Aliidongia dinghuensis TaxID=1867774 RepID=A0A8J2YS60_9PROT|nr:hypothetical protein [Aliidongia dinghuensis]GGF12442.1 hypothetical protein GCM10011611_17600 [Aliidongia dinghuensis]